jgi:transglutaminase-like putative cysteine protease
MRLTVRHRTTYAYDAPVRLGPHVLRLRPREDGTQTLRAFDLAIDPAPVVRSDALDAEGNAVVHCGFEGETRWLAIESRFEVELRRTNPFDFLPAPACAALPLVLVDRERPGLERFLRDEGVADVRAFADPIAHLSGSVVAYLASLAREMKASIRHYIRDGGLAQAPAETLSLGSGACRDIAVLFMACCRTQGIPARFMSGYRKGDLARRERDLHAWVEAWVPGGGWRGLDPTEGIAVADTHVVLAAAPEQGGTMPVEGSFAGEAGCRMDYEVAIAAS